MCPDKHHSSVDIFCLDLPLGKGHLLHPLQGNLLEERDLGVLMAVVTLLLGIVSRNYEGDYKLHISA